MLVAPVPGKEFQSAGVRDFRRAREFLKRCRDYDNEKGLAAVDIPKFQSPSD
jgi:hypothetical protein